MLEALRERGWALGGEQSGHIIDIGFVPSGDGIAAALLTLEALAGGDLADRHAMEKLPQRLVNVRFADRAALDRRGRGDRGRRSRRESAALAGRGRVLVRPSGTEPLVRVMVEAPTADEADAVCGRLVAAVEAARPDRHAARARARRPTVAPAGTSRVTTAPAPTSAPAPMRTPPRMTAPEPTLAPSSTIVSHQLPIRASVCSPPPAAVAAGRLSLTNITPWPHAHAVARS